MEVSRLDILLLLVSITAFSSSSSVPATDLTLVPRSERGPPVDPFREAPVANRPQFLITDPDYHPPRVDWFGTFATLAPHYQVYDERQSPPDAGLRPSIDYNPDTHTIVFSFTPPVPYHVEESSIMLASGHAFVYRLRDSEVTRGTQRYILFTAGNNDFFRTLDQGRAVTEDFIYRLIRTDVAPEVSAQRMAEMVQNLYAFTAPISRRQARWIATQLDYALKPGASPYKRQLLRTRRSNQRRTNALTGIQAQMQPASQNSTADATAEFSLYLNAYNELQTNISNLLFPVLNELINGTNSSLIYQMALSIYADITLSAPQVVSPFKNGMTALTSIEDQYANSTKTPIHANGTIDTGHNAELKAMMALHAVYEKLYFATWDKAIKATNSTGILSQLAMLTAYLLPKDESICPPGWLDSPLSFSNCSSTADVRAIVEYANMTQI